MAQLTLWCAVYGVGSVFPVSIVPEETVFALQKTIVEDQRGVDPHFHNVNPAVVALYIARSKQSGAWLKEDDAAHALLQRKTPPKCYERMRTSRLLKDSTNFGERTLIPAHGFIHVLVKLPTTESRQLPRGQRWVTKGSIENALRVTGIRHRLYELARNNIGYYDPQRRQDDKDTAFWYEGPTLFFHVLFKTEEKALQFRNKFDEEASELQSPLFCRRADVQTQEVPCPSTDPTWIRSEDYVAEDFPSPRGKRWICPTSPIMKGAKDLFRFQRIEGKEWFSRGLAESAHVLARWACLEEPEFYDYDENESNRLALSRDLHGWYDGLIGKVPVVNIQFLSAAETPSTEGRYKVDVLVKVWDPQTANMVFKRLKPGSEDTDDEFAMKTFVHVKCPDTFKRCLEWKYAQNELIHADAMRK